MIQNAFSIISPLQKCLLAQFLHKVVDFTLSFNSEYFEKKFHICATFVLFSDANCFGMCNLFGRSKMACIAIHMCCKFVSNYSIDDMDIKKYGFVKCNRWQQNTWKTTSRYYDFATIDCFDAVGIFDFCLYPLGMVPTPQNSTVAVNVNIACCPKFTDSPRVTNIVEWCTEIITTGIKAFPLPALFVLWSIAKPYRMQYTRNELIDYIYIYIYIMLYSYTVNIECNY